jgi:hypothetical protein
MCRSPSGEKEWVWSGKGGCGELWTGQGEQIETVPPGASTGLVTLIGESGEVTSSSTFTVP